MGVGSGSYESQKTIQLNKTNKGFGRGNKPGTKKWERKGGGHQKKEVQNEGRKQSLEGFLEVLQRIFRGP